MATDPSDRNWHSLVYSESTCDMKDDIGSLIEAIKQGQGTLKRMTAMYLLWHHVLHDPAKRTEAIQNGAVSACLVAVDDPVSDNAHKSAALGLIQGMCKVNPEEDPEALYTIATAKGSFGFNCGQEMTSFLKGTETQAAAAAAVLRALSADSRAAGVITREDLKYDRLYMDIFHLTKQDAIRANVAFFLCNLMGHSEETRKVIGAQDGIRHFVHLLLDGASEEAVTAAAHGLELLAEMDGAVPTLVQRSALLPLLDVLGDPTVTPPDPDDVDLLTIEPKVLPKEPLGEVVSGEGVPFNPYSQASLMQKEKETSEAGPAASTGPGTDGAAKTPALAPTQSTSRKELLSMQRGKTSSASLAGLPAVPERPPLASRHMSRAQLRSRAAPRRPPGGYKHDLPAISAACGVLWIMLEEDSVRDVASSNKASSRLCDAFKFVLQWTPPEQPGGKKGKGAKGKGKKGKKGMALLPEQEEALLKITGCLRQMSMLDTDKVRIARCGVAKLCDDLAMGASRGPLRWNSRSLLGNIATMVENRTILENEGVAAEYLGLCALTLTKEARADLRQFFW